MIVDVTPGREDLCFNLLNSWLPGYSIRLFNTACYRLCALSKDGRVIGALTTEKTSKWYKLTGIAVVPEYRRLGVGSSLIDHLCERISLAIKEPTPLLILHKLDFQKEFFEKNYFEEINQTYNRLIEGTYSGRTSKDSA